MKNTPATQERMARWRTNAAEATFFGYKLSTMTADELLCVIGYMMETEKQEQELDHETGRVLYQMSHGVEVPPEVHKAVMDKPWEFV